MRKRGVFFSGDALFAMIILFFVLLIIVVDRDVVTHETEVHQDILNSLSTLKVRDINNFYVESLISSGAIDDLDNSLLEQIGEFSVTDVDLARNLAAAVLVDLDLSENIGIWYGTTLIYSNNESAYENANFVDTARHVLGGISGDDENESVTGFSARAFLSTNRLSEYFYFGGYVGDGNITLNAHYDGNITNASLEVVVNNDFDLYVNGMYIGNYLGSVDEFTPVSYEIPISEFVSGDNLVEFRGDLLHVAGGFLKINYDPEVGMSYPNRYTFPGIEGLINLYDGFYVPGTLNSLNISLHMNSSETPIFLNIGNVTVFNRTTVDEEVISIDDATLSSILNYNDLSEKTVPLRLGLADFSYTGAKGVVDVFSIAEISGKMNENCGVPPCTDQSIKLIDLIKWGNEVFIDVILNDSENRAGLVGYKTSVSDDHYHNLSQDIDSLNSTMQAWTPGGGRCLCCGINRGIQGILDEGNASHFPALVVTSAETANQGCVEQGVTADLNLNGVPDDPGDDAVQAACDAFQDHGIDVYAVGFGDDTDEDTMIAIAQCGNGFYYYSAIEELSEIYKQVASQVATIYNEQTVTAIGNLHTKLYDDSYISFGYNTPSLSTGLFLSIESKFTNSFSGSFLVPSDSSVVETRVTSYSGPRWTDTVSIDENLVYNLSVYGNDYISLGDPYIVNLPTSLVGANDHLVNLTTGIEPGNSSNGSIHNKVILTIVKNASSFSEIKPIASGCAWTIEFIGGGSISVNIPDTYTGSAVCTYDSFSISYDSNDAFQEAAYILLSRLDFDSDGIVDFAFEEDDLGFSLDEVTGIPFTWSSEVQARIWF